uniref:Internexin neuronal intermediate filament protein alpha n=1 Tax=Neogobius melanostomus TaxID=47308 RepID=A0A8C6SV74_9GOBI
MSFGERSSSYRRLFGDSPRFSSGLRVTSSSVASGLRVTSSSVASGLRVSPASRSLSSVTGLYRRSGRSMKVMRTNEKEQLQGLNDRFATFIDKVRTLEQTNRGLEAELTTLRQKQAESRVERVYRDEIQQLRLQIDALSRDNSRLQVERSSQEAEQEVELQLEEESALRAEAELALKNFSKDVDEATAVRMDLERRLDALSQEICFMKKVHQEELEELSSFMEAQQASPAEVELLRPDLTSALKEIRGQYESMAVKNLQASEDWFRSKLASLTEQAARSGEAVRASREELGDFRRTLQTRTIEIQSLRAANDSLEKTLSEMEEAHTNETAALQDTISHLDAELRNIKGEMAEHLREYQDLLNVKMALDIEIAAYRSERASQEEVYADVDLLPSCVWVTLASRYTLWSFVLGLESPNTVSLRKRHKLTNGQSPYE